MSKQVQARKLQNAVEVVHPDHSKDIHRLNRIQGQINGVRKMIEDRRYCPEILIQTRAVKAAIQSLETAILERHLHHCVQETFKANKPKDVEAKIKELIDLFQKNI